MHTTHMSMHVCVHVYVHIHAHARAHAHTPVPLNILTHVPPDTSVHKSLHMSMHARAHTQVVHTRACVHVHGGWAGKRSGRLASGWEDTLCISFVGAVCVRLHV